MNSYLLHMTRIGDDYKTWVPSVVINIVGRVVCKILRGGFSLLSTYPSSIAGIYLI